MAIIMISELPGAGPEFADVARQQGLFDQMKSAPGFMGHWSGTTDSGYRVFEVWESPEAHQAWLDGTVKPQYREALWLTSGCRGLEPRWAGVYSCM